MTWKVKGKRIHATTCEKFAFSPRIHKVYYVTVSVLAEKYHTDSCSCAIVVPHSSLDEDLVAVTRGVSEAMRRRLSVYNL